MAEDNFDINSLATYLHMTPPQVKKMAERGKLPGRRVGNEWVFPKPEIHQWFETRIGTSDEKELVQVEKVLETAEQPVEATTASISSLLPIEHVFIPLAARTKNSVINQMCEECAETGALWDPTRMTSAIFDRESLHPTALDNGVALLHPRRPQPGIINDSFLALGVTTTGLPFGGPRGTMTDIFFLIASADEATHLKVLARISRLIQVPDLLDQLREASTPQQALDCLLTSEEELR